MQPLYIVFVFLFVLCFSVLSSWSALVKEWVHINHPKHATFVFFISICVCVFVVFWFHVVNWWKSWDKNYATRWTFVCIRICIYICICIFYRFVLVFYYQVMHWSGNINHPNLERHSAETSILQSKVILTFFILCLVYDLWVNLITTVSPFFSVFDSWMNSWLNYT